MTQIPDPTLNAQAYDGTTSKRLLAWLIDTVIIIALSCLVVVLTAFVGALFWVLLYAVIGFAYRTLTIAGGSATWGMRAMGIELRDAYGEPLDTGQALAHTAGYTLSMSFPILQVVSVIMMLTNDRGQGLSDAVLGTVMVNR